MQQRPLSRSERWMLAFLDFFLVAIPLALLILFFLALSLKHRPDTAPSKNLRLYPVCEEYTVRVSDGVGEMEQAPAAHDRA